MTGWSATMKFSTLIAGKTTTLGAGMSTDATAEAYKDGARVRATGEPYGVWFDDSPETLAFWNGYYGRTEGPNKD